MSPVLSLDSPLYHLGGVEVGDPEATTKIKDGRGWTDVTLTLYKT